MKFFYILLLRHFLQEGELSADLYNFHEVVSQLQQQEDEVLDLHKDAIDLQRKWLEEDIELLNSTREVDYDQEGKFLLQHL